MKVDYMRLLISFLTISLLERLSPKIKSPKEVYEVRQERGILQRQQTHYLKEFSPHSNKLKGITGLPIARPVTSFSLSHEEEDSRGSLFNDEWREPSNLLKVSEVKNSLSEDPINLNSPNWANYNKLSKISEVKSESRASEDDDYPLSPLIKVREISMEYRQDKLKQREIGEQYAISLINGIPNRYDESPRRNVQKPSILINSPDKSSPSARQRSPSPGINKEAPRITASPLSFDQSPKPLLNNTQPQTIQWRGI